jgi:hypothetical protein
MAANDKIIDELKSILNLVAMASLKHCLRIWLKGLTNTMGNFSQSFWLSWPRFE